MSFVYYSVQYNVITDNAKINLQTKSLEYVLSDKRVTRIVVGFTFLQMLVF